MFNNLQDRLDKAFQNIRCGCELQNCQRIYRQGEGKSHGRRCVDFCSPWAANG